MSKRTMSMAMIAMMFASLMLIFGATLVLSPSAVNAADVMDMDHFDKPDLDFDEPDDADEAEDEGDELDDKLDELDDDELMVL